MDGTTAPATRPPGGSARNLSRRDLLKLAAVGAAATAAGAVAPLGRSASTADWVSSLSSSKMPRPYTRPLALAQPLPYRMAEDVDGPYRLYTVTQTTGQMSIIDGLPTPALGYGWTGVDGNPRFAVPGPYLSVPQGVRTKLRVKNGLPAAHPQWGYEMTTSTHLHGSASLPQYDGYADDVTAPGFYKDYDYPNFQPARTLWYHDHGVHHTAKSAYSGLLAQYHLHDAAETDLLPQGKYDVPLTISDALFDTAGRLVYGDNDFSGLWGDVVLVNGTPWPYLDVERRVYRFRVLMATMSRSMNLRLVNTRNGATVPVHVVATDGGLMPYTQTVDRWKQAGAERYEVLVDFGHLDIQENDQIELRNASASNNRDYLHTGKVMRFVAKGPRVTDGTNKSIPRTLVQSTAMNLTAGMASKVRRLELKHDNVTNMFNINGKMWHDVQNSGYTLLADGANPERNAVEIWEIQNTSGGWFHPLHIHLVDFQVLSRRGGSGRVEAWERGPKDVVYVGEGETVRVIAKYEMAPSSRAAQGGRYMIHCHNLPHEDNDMMMQFQVGTTPQTNDPITADPPKPIPASGNYPDGPEVTASMV